MVEGSNNIIAVYRGGHRVQATPKFPYMARKELNCIRPLDTLRLDPFNVSLLGQFHGPHVKSTRHPPQKTTVFVCRLKSTLERQQTQAA